MMDRLLAALQTVLPQHLLSHFVGWLANSRLALVRMPFIGIFRRLYRVDLSDSDPGEPGAYTSFNAFFTRALRDGAREIAQDAVISPVDGVVSQCGTIRDGQLLQAKGQHYSAAALLASGEASEKFADGSFITIYLAPHNYHRVHVPLPARLKQMTFVPGRLFSVSPSTTRAVNGLFTRNERAVFYFDTSRGETALVMVGALIVGSIETVHAGIIRSSGTFSTEYDPPLEYGHAQQLAQFNVGSTVILLFEKNGPRLEPYLAPGIALRLGQAIAR